MTNSNFTLGQRKGLYNMLRDQNSPMTESEKEMFFELQKEFRNVKCEFISEVVTFEGMEFFRNGMYVKQTEMDTFGEDYRNCWIRVQESGKGEFVSPAYMGRRIYLD